MINIKKVLNLGNKQDKKIYQELRNFRGHKVVDVIPFNTGTFSGFYLKFSNGKYITGVDGEYGDNTLEIKNIPQFKKDINKTREYIKQQEEYKKIEDKKYKEEEKKTIDSMKKVLK